LEPILRLSEINSIRRKLDFIQDQPGLSNLQFSFFRKKTIINSLGLSEFFDKNFSQNLINFKSLDIVERNKQKGKVLNSVFNFQSYSKALLVDIVNKNKLIGVIFLPLENNPPQNLLALILNFKNQIECQIQIKNIDKKLSKSNKELRNKLLEIESLIDVTEIINSQHGLKQNLFENILITILSILNASKGMVLLKDEKSGFFNVISQFNILKEELPSKIIRITKGLMKELNESKISKIIEEPKKYEILKASQKNCIASPIITGKSVEGVLLLFDKESRSGLIKFNHQDLRLFDSLSKKVSLAYDNIRLIDSLKTSNNLVDNIMSSITTGIIMINVLGEIEFVNHSAKKIFSIEQEGTLNNHYFMVFQNNPNLISLLEASEIKDEIIYEDNFKIEDSSQTIHEINLTLSPVYNEDNERSGVVFSFEDLSGINKIKSTFKKYVSENIVDELLENENSLELGGAQNEVCVLFSDIRGFTALSEKMKPSEVVYLLNTYFEAMIDVVFSHNGTLDKIIGDELMVLYGVPLKNKNDSQSAVNSALSMFKALEKFNEQMAIENLPNLEIGIGINYGKVVSGNIGSERQMNYTVIGDAVNLASRLCSHAKSGEVVISKSVFEKLDSNQGFKSQKPIMVKGKSKEIENWIYSAI
jgi:class 3 adenylate cyclase